MSAQLASGSTFLTAYLVTSLKRHIIDYPRTEMVTTDIWYSKNCLQRSIVARVDKVCAAHNVGAAHILPTTNRYGNVRFVGRPEDIAAVVSLLDSMIPTRIKDRGAIYAL